MLDIIFSTIQPAIENGWFSEIEKVRFEAMHVMCVQFDIFYVACMKCLSLKCDVWKLK